jgi:hypothetical protein
MRALSLFKRIHCNGKILPGQWLLVGYHPTNSITWTWAVYWDTPSQVRRFSCHLWRGRGGSFELGAPFIGRLRLHWQEAMPKVRVCP